MSAAPAAPACAECGRLAALKSGRDVWPRRHDLADRILWVCPCGARVGCHPGTFDPLGRPGGAATRKARQMAHDAFDPLWRRKMERDGVSQSSARGSAYKWLAGELGLDAAVCHIGMMDRATARRVVQVCAPFARKLP